MWNFASKIQSSDRNFGDLAWSAPHVLLFIEIHSYIHIIRKSVYRHYKVTEKLYINSVYGLINTWAHVFASISIYIASMRNSQSIFSTTWQWHEKDIEILWVSCWFLVTFTGHVWQPYLFFHYFLHIIDMFALCLSVYWKTDRESVRYTNRQTFRWMSHVGGIRLMYLMVHVFTLLSTGTRHCLTTGTGRISCGWNVNTA